MYIPSQCSDLDGYGSQSAIGDMTLTGDGSGLKRPAPDGATLVLGCQWTLGDDVTGVTVLISTASSAAVNTAVTGLSSQGYTCAVADDFGAIDCENNDASAKTQHTVLARDNTWIYVESSNRDDNDFVSSIAGQVLNGK